MNAPIPCTSLEEVRAHIDAIDRQIVKLLAERGGFISQAARFKKNTEDVKAPQRVEQVISKISALSEELGGNRHVIEATYRTMIAAFTDAELTEHRTIKSTSVGNCMTAASS